MTEKIKQHLVEYAASKNWQTDDDTLFEIVRESKEVYSEKISSHRWYDDTFIVVEVNGMYIGYHDFYMTGDNNASDMGLDYDINSICEVRPVEKRVIVYEKVNPASGKAGVNHMTDPNVKAEGQEEGVAEEAKAETANEQATEESAEEGTTEG